MGLRAEMKTGTVKPVGREEGSRANDRPGNPAKDKEIILRTLRRIADLWNEIETSGGLIAWEWILRGSSHGGQIRQTEDRVNAIGSKGKVLSS